MAEQQKGNATVAPAGNGTLQVRLTKPDGNATPVGNATVTPAVGNASTPVATNSIASAGKASVVVPSTKKTDTPPASDTGFWWTVGLLIGLVVVVVLMWRSGVFHRISIFAEEVREQLRKCTWPTGHELAQHVVVVLLGTLMLGAFTMLSELIARETVWGALLNTKTILFNKN